MLDAMRTHGVFMFHVYVYYEEVWSGPEVLLNLGYGVVCQEEDSNLVTKVSVFFWGGGSPYAYVYLWFRLGRIHPPKTAERTLAPYISAWSRNMVE